MLSRNKYLNILSKMLVTSLLFLLIGNSVCHAQEQKRPDIHFLDICMERYFSTSTGVYFNRYAMMSAIPPESPQKVNGADPETFELIRCKFAKDKNHVYYTDKKINDADAASFGIFEGDTTCIFFRDNRYVFDGKGNRLEGSDSKSFKRLSNYYFCDKNQVYASSPMYPNGIILKGIDPSTIEIVGEIFLLNQGLIFRNGELITNIDPYTYEALEDGYGCDRENLYYNEIKIENGDASSFKKLLYGKPKKDYTWVEEKYYRDSTHIFLQGNALNGANPNEYKIPRKLFLISNGNVYYKGDKIENVDVATFELLPTINLSKDKNNVYYDNKIFQGADSKTFKHLNRHIAYDKNNLYSNTTIISKIDGTSLTIINENHMVLKDDNYIYLTDRVDGPLLDKVKVDGKTLVPIKNKYMNHYDHIYYKDRDHIYRYSYGSFKLIKEANPTSFRLIDSDTSIDDTGLYHQNKLVTSIDGKSFYRYKKDETICKDDNYLYYFIGSGLSELISKIKVDGRNLVKLSHSFYKDKNYIYYLDFRKFICVKDADLDSFEVTAGNAGKDKNHEYIDGKRVKD